MAADGFSTPPSGGDDQGSNGDRARQNAAIRQDTPRQDTPRPGAIDWSWNLPDALRGDQGDTAADQSGQAPPWTPPDAPYQPFIGSPGNRTANQWGTPDLIRSAAMRYPGGMLPNPWMPGPRDMPGLMNRIVRYMGQNGSGFSAMPMINAGRTSLAYMKAFVQGQKDRAALLHQQFVMQAEQADRNLAEELREYGDAWSEYGPSADGKYAGNPTMLHQRMEQIARARHDEPMLTAIAQNDWKAAERLLQGRDKNHQDLGKLLDNRRKELEIQLEQERIKNEQAKRQAKNAAEDPYRIHPPAASGVPDTNVSTPIQPDAVEPSPVEPDTVTPSPDSPAPSGPSADPDGGRSPSPPTLNLGQAQSRSDRPATQVAAAPSSEPLQAVPDAGPEDPRAALAMDPQARPSPTGGDIASQVAQLPSATQPRSAGVTPTPVPPPATQPLQSQVRSAMRAQGWDDRAIDKIADQMLLGTWKETAGRSMPNVVTWARRLAIEKAQQLDSIQSDRSIKPEQVIDRVRSVSQTLGDDIDNLVKGTVAPPRGASLTRAPWDRIYALAHKADPNLTQAAFATRARTLADFSAGFGQRNITAIKTAYEHLKALRESIRNEPGFVKRTLGSTPFIEPLYEKLDPESARRMARIANELNTAQSEYERALVGGKPTQTAREEQKLEAGVLRYGPQYIIANIDDKIDRLGDRMDQNREAFVAGTGMSSDQLMKRFDHDTAATIDDLHSRARPLSRPTSSDPAARPKGGDRNWQEFFQ